MRLAWILLCLTGCSAMAPSGDPLAPVVVETSPPAGVPTTDASPTAAAPEAPASAATPTGDEAEAPFTISSEQLQANVAEAKAEGLPPANPDLPVPTDATADGAAIATAAPTPAPAAPAVAPAPAPTPTSTPTVAGWPVRLIKTVPEAQPPRAILAMPDGKEVVVTPGQLLPDLGLVVLGIGSINVQFAQVTPSGDHASIAPLTLLAQY